MDTTEFKRRFLPCHKRFYHTAFRLTGNTQDAEDLVQEAYANYGTGETNWREWKTRKPMV